MPATAQLIARGCLRPMTVSLPEISSVSWSSFMTGTNPGEHGIFGFTDLDPSTYRLRFPSYLELRAPTLWERLGAAGKRSIVINQPATYPARPLAGVLISGFVAIELGRAVYPPEKLPRLQEMGYRIDIDLGRSRQDPAFLFQELAETHAGRRRAVELLWEEEWDYFEVVVTGTDRLHHILWEAVAQAQHEFHAAALEYYRRVDELIGWIAARCEDPGDSARLYLLSDHGFTGIRQEVYLNAWLRERGWLVFEQDDPDSLEELAGPTRAFALDPSRIYLHRRDRFARGEVEAADAAKLKKELRDELLRLEWQGEKVLAEVFDANEIYSGPEAAKGPDLVLLSRPGFDLKGTLKSRQVFGRSGLQGMHTRHNAFFLAPHDLPREVGICDPCAWLLEHLS